jgi:hypothetical protein
MHSSPVWTIRSWQLLAVMQCSVLGCQATALHRTVCWVLVYCTVHAHSCVGMLLLQHRSLLIRMCAACECLPGMRQSAGAGCYCCPTMPGVWVGTCLQESRAAWLHVCWNGAPERIAQRAHVSRGYNSSISFAAAQQQSAAALALPAEYVLLCCTVVSCLGWGSLGD